METSNLLNESILSALDFAPPCGVTLCDQTATYSAHWVGTCPHAGMWLYCAADAAFFTRMWGEQETVECQVCNNGVVFTDLIIRPLKD